MNLCENSSLDRKVSDSGRKKKTNSAAVPSTLAPKGSPRPHALTIPLQLKCKQEVWLLHDGSSREKLGVFTHNQHNSVKD